MGPPTFYDFISLKNLDVKPYATRLRLCQVVKKMLYIYKLDHASLSERSGGGTEGCLVITYEMNV